MSRPTSNFLCVCDSVAERVEQTLTVEPLHRKPAQQKRFPWRTPNEFATRIQRTTHHVKMAQVRNDRERQRLGALKDNERCEHSHVTLPLLDMSSATNAPPLRFCSSCRSSRRKSESVSVSIIRPTSASVSCSVRHRVCNVKSYKLRTVRSRVHHICRGQQPRVSVLRGGGFSERFPRKWIRDYSEPSALRRRIGNGSSR